MHTKYQIHFNLLNRYKYRMLLWHKWILRLVGYKNLEFSKNCTWVYGTNVYVSFALIGLKYVAPSHASYVHLSECLITTFIDDSLLRKEELELKVFRDRFDEARLLLIECVLHKMLCVLVFQNFTLNWRRNDTDKKFHFLLAYIKWCKLEKLPAYLNF